MIGLALIVIVTMPVGIGNAAKAPTLAPVNPNVPVRVPRLTPDDVIKSAPLKVHHWSISPITLMPINDSVTFTKSYGGIREANGTFYAPVHLPDGVSITSLTAYVHEDSEPGTTIEVLLYRSPHSTASIETMFMVDSQNIESSYYAFEMIRDIAMPSTVSPVVDNANDAYFLRATFDNPNPSDYQRLGNIIITYTMP